MEQGVASETIQEFLDRLASSAATPGGGAAAAIAGAQAAALVSLVCNLTIGRPRYASVDAAMRAILAESEAARARLVRLADDDAAAFTAVASAYRLPRSTEEDRAARQRAVQAALIGASAPPLATVHACRALLPLVLQVAAHGNSTVVGDAGVAAELAVAAARSSFHLLRLNLAAIDDPAFVSEGERELAAAENGLADDLNRVVAIVRAKLARKP
jgi:formiminotetrahydrofolate cyclodeaminase